MHPHWENNKARETTVATHIQKILLFLENESFFKRQTHFLLNVRFHHNLNVVLFSICTKIIFTFLNIWTMYWSIRQSAIFQGKGIFNLKETTFHTRCNRLRKDLRVVWKIWFITWDYITWSVYLYITWKGSLKELWIKHIYS